MAEHNWIVLGDRNTGMTYGPFALESEARSFAAQVPGRLAMTWSAACSQIETCVAYGLPYKALAK